MAGIGDRVEGKAKELKGKITGDKTEEAEGKAQQATGKMKGKLEEARKKSAETTRSRDY
jgi:uncharacterized protein YjbJ (UPF0337 family)